MRDVTFDMDALGPALDRLVADAGGWARLDALPFGVIRLDPAGRVAAYSATESRQAGCRVERAVGLDFFTELAPCMNTPHLRGRIEQAARDGSVDLEFGHTGDFADPDAFLRIRVVSAADGGFWHAHDRS